MEELIHQDTFKMKNIIAITFLLSCSLLNAQTMIENHAQKLYESFAFSEASLVYADIIKKKERKSESTYKDCLRAGECFYHSREYSKAAFYYGQAHSEQALANANLRMYFDALLRTEDLNKAASIGALLGQDPNDDSFTDIVSFQSKNDSKKDYFKLEVAEFNSGEGDYGAVQINSEVYFSSNRNEFGYTHEHYEWDNRNFSNMFMVDSAMNVSFRKEYASEYHDGPVAVLGNEIYLTRTNYIKRGKKYVKYVKVVVGTKSGDDITWKEFKYNGDNYNVGHVSFSTDGQTMYFASDKKGGQGGSDIYSSKLVNGEWAEPVNLGTKVNSSQDELFPYVNGDIMYFASNGFLGYGGMDVYRFDLISNDKVENLGPGINSTMDDFAYWVDADNKYGYVSSDRTDGIDRIYNVDVNIIKGTLIVTPRDIFKNQKIEDVDIYVVDRATGDSTKLIADENGNYPMEIESRKDYIITGTKDNYELDAPLYLNTDKLKPNEIIEKDLMFNHTHYDLLVKTVIKGTNESAPNVIGMFTDPETGEKIPFKTDENGTAYVNIENNHLYEVFARKKGYLDYQDAVLTNAETVIEIDLELEEIKEDLVFEIKNILYDLAKWDLRPESIVELDRLVEFLTLNDNIKVELSSHTDSRASNSYNQRLSQKRAQSCVDYLIDQGIASNRIIAKGYGESKLLNKCSNGVECTEEEHQRNRRTEIKILSVE